MHTGPGKSLCNALRVLGNGEVLLEYAKQVLPTNNTFDERRHFEPGPDVAKVLRISNTQVGFLIGEDGWNGDGANCAINPWDRLTDTAPDLVIRSASTPVRPASTCASSVITFFPPRASAIAGRFST